MSRRILVTVLVLVACVFACAIVRCARGDADSSSSSGGADVANASADRLEPPPPTDPGVWGRFPRAEKSDSAKQAPPGIRELVQQRAQVIGTLDYRDIAGGSYCVVDCYPWDEVAEADVLATVTLEEDAGLYGFFEAYVSADGVLSAEDGLPMLAIDDVRSVGDAEWDISWSLASREKPCAVTVDNDLRVVGTLIFVEQYREARTDSWAVVDALEPAMVKDGVGRFHVIAFLDSIGFTGEMPPAGSYVEASGPQIDSKLISGSRWPVIQAVTVDMLP